MPPKKAQNKGKKSTNKDKPVEKPLEEIIEKEALQIKHLKLSNWTQDNYSLEVIFFAGRKLKGDDVDVTFSEQRCDLKLTDGREWHMNFFKPIDMKASRVQIKGLRLNLKVKKQTPGHWLDVEYVPGQSDPPTEKMTVEKEQKPTSSTKGNNSTGKQDETKTISNGVGKSSSENKKAESFGGKDITRGSSILDEICKAEPDITIGGGKAVGSNVSQNISNSVGIEVNNKEALKDLNNKESTEQNQFKPDITDLLGDEKESSTAEDKLKDDKGDTEENVYNLLHVKNDFFEKTVAKANDTVSVQIFVKQIIKESLQVLFEGRDVSVKFRSKDPKFLSMYEGTDENTVFGWKIEVVDLLLENQCKHKLTGSYLELTLRKKEPRRWAALEAMHTKGKIVVSTDWVSASNSKSTAKVQPNNATPSAAAMATTSSATKSSKSKVIFDEMTDTENKTNKTSEWTENQKNAASTSKGYVLGDGTNKDTPKKPTCMVSPLKPPKEKQVVTPGYTGLDNLGNTCFMNSVLQVLANTRELRDYFLDGHFQKEINVDNPLGSGGKIAIEFAMLLKVLWSGTKYSYAPTNLKKLVAQKKSMFMGFAQHDAQEYMSFLLDGLHEDVNKVKKKPYIEQIESDDRQDEDVAAESWSNHKKRNDSFLVDLFQGQYKSTLVCPVCDKVSVTFDPFMHLPVPMPKKQRLLPFLFKSRDPRRKPVRYMLRIPKDATVEVLKDLIFQRTNVEPKNLRVYESYHSKIQCFFEKGDSLNHVQSHDKIIVHEVLSEKLAGEPVTELVVVQRLSVPIHRPSRCACCRIDEKEGQKLQRCTGCYRVGYCKTECQKQHWSQHKNVCRSIPDAVGMPFIISLPKSQTTFSRVSQMAEMYSRYSVDIFQPPQEMNIPCSEPSSPASTSDLLSNSGAAFQANEATSDYHSASSLSNESSSKSLDTASCSADSLGTDKVDSGRETDAAFQVQNDDNNPKYNTMSSSVTSSQDSESSAGDAGVDPMSVSTSSTSLSSLSYSDENNTQEESNKGKENQTKVVNSADKTENTTKDTPTRIVMGRQQDPEKPAPQFYLKPCEKDGNLIKGRKKFTDLGEEPLNLDGVLFLGMDWKNSEKDRPFVQVTTKETIYDEDPNMASVFLEENKNVNLQQCLSLFTEPEVLSSEEAWYCPRCKEHREASKQLSLWRLPNVLIIQLKRFSYRNLLWCDKVEKIVEFPTSGLDMSPFFVGKFPDNEPPPLYDLYGVVNHYGGIMGGHYTAYTKCVSAQDQTRNEVGWRSCDDSHVSNTSENQVVTRAGYVLFYRRRDMHVDIPASLDITSNCEETEVTSKEADLQAESKIFINNAVDKNDDEVNHTENEIQPMFTIAPECERDTDISQSLAGLLDYGTSYGQFGRGLRQRSHSYTNVSEFMKSKTTDTNLSITPETDRVPKSYSDMDSVD